jgi:hypothetical protein
VIDDVAVRVAAEHIDAALPILRQAHALTHRAVQGWLRPRQRRLIDPSVAMLQQTHCVAMMAR